MKKICIAISTVFLSMGLVATQTSAQTIGIAPEAGVNFSNIIGDNTDGNDMKLGFKVGANVNIPLSENLYLSPGLHYSVKGTQNEVTLPIVGTYTAKTNLGYLEVPINLMYRVPVGAGSVFFSAGPYVAFGIAGNYTLNDDEKAKVDWGSDLLETNPLDIGINAGIGYELPMGLYLRAQYGHGLTTLSNVKDVKRNNQNIQLSLGYNLWTWAR